MIWVPPSLRAALLSLVAALLVGCASDSNLPVAPNVLRDGSGSIQLKALPPEQQKTSMQIMYVTDRAVVPEETKGGNTTYGFGRSPHVSYGMTTVSFDKSVSWNELVRYSGSPSDRERYEMKVTGVRELGQFAPTLDRLTAKNGKLVIGDTEAEHNETLAAQETLTKLMANYPQKDVYIFVHGFNNNFDDAVLRMAGIWHYLGRRGMPVVYTWPAGHGGLLGYFYDRESGEFTIYHLKRTLRIIAGCPSVERIHIIAHSRGTDVATTALRELNEYYKGAGKDPQVELKLQTLALAAPDLDKDVFAQRFGSEGLANIAAQVVIYGSEEDAAIAFARKLFGSSGRMGSFDPAKAPPQILATLSQAPSIQFVRTKVTGFSTSHAYMFANPAAMSDLVLLLRDQKQAGAENGRPMEKHPGWWYLSNSYFDDKTKWVKEFHAD